MSETQPDPEPTEDAPATELQDPEDYHRQQRLKEIHKRRQQAAKAIDGVNGYARRNDKKTQVSHLAHAVASYIAEVEPLFHTTETDTDLQDRLPWDDISKYADNMGIDPNTGDYAHYADHVNVYRQVNHMMAEVRPLVEPEDNNTWEV